MVKDPLSKWDGAFPYDVLAQAGITPDSSMKEVLDASYELMAGGLMTPEVRTAWDQLRLKQKRLLVDFFLYRFDPQTELEHAQEAFEQQLAELVPVPDVSHWLKVDAAALNQMDQDFREIPLRKVELSIFADFDSNPAIRDPNFIQFDM